MTNPLHAKWYADRATQHDVVVVERRALATDTWLVRLECPAVAARITAGQFLMVRLTDGSDPLLGRAFAMYDVVANERGEPTCVDIVFHVIGKMTSLLSRVEAGQALRVWGPLGNGFQPQPCSHLIMVAGGIGQTPFLALARESLGVQAYGGRRAEPVKRVTLCYGARSAAFHADVAKFRELGVEVFLATDDGTAGHHGLVTELLQQHLDAINKSEFGQTRICCCGPEPMMEAVGAIGIERGVPCEVSLETPMACGLGICFSCVARVRQPDGTWDYKRTCVDGPVFGAADIVW